MVLGSDSGRRLPSQEPPWLHREGKGGDRGWRWGCGQGNPGGGLGGELTKQSLAMKRNLRKQQFVLMGQKAHTSGCVCVVCVCKWDSANVSAWGECV